MPRAGGSRINHVRLGAGDPLVLIHGLGGSLRIWEPVLERVASRREVIAVDLPGFGDSPELPPDLPPSPANLARAVAGLCAELDLPTPHVAGNSLGGWVALEMGRGDAARSVAGISAAGLWKGPLRPRRFDLRRAARWCQPLIGPVVASRRLREHALRGVVARPDLIDAPTARGLVDDWLRGTGYAAANREMRARYLDHPEEITVPVTLAWGDRDRLVSRPKPDRAPPGARIVVLEGCGHTPTWDDPERVGDLLIEASEQSPADRVPAT